MRAPAQDSTYVLCLGARDRSRLDEFGAGGTGSLRSGVWPTPVVSGVLVCGVPCGNCGQMSESNGPGYKELQGLMRRERAHP